MDSKKVIIKTSARLHFNSLKMNQAGGRGCGGVGVALSEPVLEMEFSYNKKVIVSGGNDYLVNKTIIFARSIIKYLGLLSGVKIEIKKFFPSHIGLGSGTQLGLGVGKGISLLYGKEIALKDIASINKRAGVSGVGYYSFMHGGVIIDGGYRMGINEDKKTFGDHASHPPSLIGRYEFPENWKILLITPTSPLVDNEVDESSLFIENTPVLLTEVGAICTNTLMGLIPSLLDKNYFEFINNLFDVIRFGTKKIELELNRKALAKVMKSLDDMLVYKWKRLDSCKYILVSDEHGLPYKRNSEQLDPLKRYEVRDEFSCDMKNFSRNKIPFLGISSLGPTMYSILLEGYHNPDFLLKTMKEKIGSEWDVKIVSAKNDPYIYEIIK